MTDEPSTSGPGSGRGAVLRYGPAILIAVVAGLFIGQNRQDASIGLLWTTVTAPLWLVLSALFLAGLVTGALLARRRSRRRGA